MNDTVYLHHYNLKRTTRESCSGRAQWWQKDGFISMKLMLSSTQPRSSHLLQCPSVILLQFFSTRSKVCISRFFFFIDRWNFYISLQFPLFPYYRREVKLVCSLQRTFWMHNCNAAGVALSHTQTIMKLKHPPASPFWSSLLFSRWGYGHCPPMFSYFPLGNIYLYLA